MLETFTQNRQRFPKEGTQQSKVLKELLDANGEWVSKQVFIRKLYLTQVGARIYELENDYGWPIEHSEFFDQYGFKSYRILPEGQLTLF